MAQSSIDFLLQADVEGISFNPLRPEGLAQNAESPHLNISIKPKAEWRFHGSECRVYCSVAASEQQCKFVSSLIEGRFIILEGSPISLPYTRESEVLIEADGSIAPGYRPLLDVFPVDLQEIVLSAQQKLQKMLVRYLGLLRWRQGLQSAPFVGVERGPLYWKVGGEQYHAIRIRTGSKKFIQSPRGVRWGEDREVELAVLWSNGSSEPLAHELLQEAVSVADSAPRSALLIACSALEAGLKHHIGQRVPEAEWLVMEMPSPPIFKILRDYLPKLHSSQKNNGDWEGIKNIAKKCQKLIEIRNKLTHAGIMPSDVDVKGYIDVVRDALYTLDALSGHDWAKGWVSYEVRKALNWPGSSEELLEISFSISEPY